MKKITGMVNRHNDHDNTSQDVDGIDPVAAGICG